MGSRACGWLQLFAARPRARPAEWTFPPSGAGLWGGAIRFGKGVQVSWAAFHGKRDKPVKTPARCAQKVVCSARFRGGGVGT